MKRIPAFKQKDAKSTDSKPTFKTPDPKGKEPMPDIPRKVCTPENDTENRAFRARRAHDENLDSSKKKRVWDCKISEGSASQASSSDDEVSLEDKSGENKPGSPKIIFPLDSSSVSNDDNFTFITKKNWSKIIERLGGNDPSIIALKIEFSLSKEQLEELKDAISHNTTLGFISWNKKQIASGICGQIELHLIDNVKNFKYHPTDFVHGLLSKHVYEDCVEGDSVFLSQPQLIKQNSLVENWKVCKVYDDTKSSGYYGVLYENPKTHNFVLATRGTKSSVLDVLKRLFETNNVIKTDIEEILGGQIVVGQQAQNYKSTEYAIKKAARENYRLSFTGHSLGGWLAELGVFYCRTFFSEHKVDIKAVTFDSPGTAPMMEKLNSNILNRAKTLLEDLPIVTYLASPNPVNCCNRHVGKVFCVEVDMVQTDHFDAKASKIGKVNKNLEDEIKRKVHGLLAIEGHGLSKILHTFDSQSSKPKKCKEMADWPKLEYKGSKTFANNGTNLMEVGIESLCNVVDFTGVAKLVVPTAVSKVAEWIIGDKTLMSIIGLLKSVITGEIDQAQYWAYFNHKDKKDSFKDDFALCGKAHYRIDKNAGSCILNSKLGSTDEYLFKLHNKYQSNLKNSDSSSTKALLLDLLSRYTIQPYHEEYRLIANPGYDIEGIKEYARRIREVTDKSLLKPISQEAVPSGPQDRKLPEVNKTGDQANPKKNQNDSGYLVPIPLRTRSAPPGPGSPKKPVNEKNQAPRAPREKPEVKPRVAPPIVKRAASIHSIKNLRELQELQTSFANKSNQDLRDGIKGLSFKLKIDETSKNLFLQLLETISKDEQLLPQFTSLCIGEIDKEMKVSFPKLTKLETLEIKEIGKEVKIWLQSCQNLENFAIRMNNECELNFCGQKLDKLKVLIIKNIMDSVISAPISFISLTSLTIGNSRGNIGLPGYGVRNLKNLNCTSINDIQRLKFENTRLTSLIFASIETLTIANVCHEKPDSLGEKTFYYIGAKRFQKKPDFEILTKFVGLKSFSIKNITDDTILEFPNLQNDNLKTLEIYNINKNVVIKPSPLLSYVVKFSIHSISDKAHFKLPEFPRLNKLSFQSVGKAVKIKIPRLPKDVDFTVLRSSDAKIDFSRNVDKKTKDNIKSIWKHSIGTPNLPNGRFSKLLSESDVSNSSS